MATQPVRIIDAGRGPQIEGHRLTAMDVFFYVHRGYDFKFIQRAMPTLRRDEYDAAYAYIQGHYEELKRRDDAIEERNRMRSEEQIRRSLFEDLPEDSTTEERVARLMAKLELKKQAAAHVHVAG